MVTPPPGGNALRFETISFLSDYGHGDEFVGVVHSVIRSIAPGVRVLDITHAIEPYNVRAGGLALVPGADWLAGYEDSSEALKGAVRAWFGGTPAEKREQYIVSSATTYVEQVQAPVLIIQGRHDTRVPPREVETYEAKMRALGKPLEVVWYDAGHGSTSVGQTIEFVELMLNFANRTLAE